MRRKLVGILLISLGIIGIYLSLEYYTLVRGFVIILCRGCIGI